MSIEQDWAKIRERAGRSDMGTTAVTRCIVDLADKVQALQDRVDEMEKVRPIHIPPGHWVATVAPERTPPEPDPSDWVGDLCMFGRQWEDDCKFGPFVLTLVGEDDEFLYVAEIPYGCWSNCRPATDEDRIMYKGVPPTVNGELCMVRGYETDKWYGPEIFVGIIDSTGEYVTREGSMLESWKYARRLTPLELKQHQAGQEESK